MRKKYQKDHQQELRLVKKNKIKAVRFDCLF